MGLRRPLQLGRSQWRAMPPGPGAGVARRDQTRRTAMIPRLPMCCSPEAFQLLASQVQTINSPDALLHAACAVAMHQYPESDPGASDAQRQDYAETVRSRV